MASRGTAKLDSKKCLAARYNSRFCSRCQSVCPAEAITITNNNKNNSEDVIDKLSCTGCGICTTVCPLEAIKIKNAPDDKEILDCVENSIHREGTVVFTCRQKLTPPSGNQIGIVKFNCLGQLDVNLLLGCYSRQIKRIIIDTSSCEKTCGPPQGTAVNEHLNNLKGKISRFSEHINQEMLLDINPETWKTEEERSSNFSRRDVFSYFRNEISNAATDMVQVAGDNLKDDKPIKGFKKDTVYLPFRRRLFFQALEDLNITHLPSQLSQLSLKNINKNSCRFCLTCTKVCPTKALKSKIDNDLLKIWHEPFLCVNCRACETTCPEQAIASSSICYSRDSFQNYEDCHCIYKQRKDNCDLCGTLIPENTDQLCFLCRHVG